MRSNVAMAGGRKIEEEESRRGSSKADVLVFPGPLVDSRDEAGAQWTTVAPRFDVHRPPRRVFPTSPPSRPHPAGIACHAHAMRRLLLTLAILLAFAHPAAAGFYDLLNAARLNDTAAARELLAAGTEPNGGPSGFPDSYSPLQWAARHGNTELIALLLEAGADTERRDFNGDRPLLWAARAGQAGAIRALVAAGSPVSSDTDPSGNAPLTLAARGGSADALRALIDAGAWLDFGKQGGAALREAALAQAPDAV